MQFKRTLGLLFFGMTLIACNLFSGNPPAAPTATIQPTAVSSSVDPRFLPVLPALKVVNIPLRLLPSIEDYPKGAQGTLYITILSAEATSYDLAITLQPDCSAHVCTQGHLIGQ